MGINADAIARVTGIETKYQDMRSGGLLFLPQRIAVIGQGASDAVYSSGKWKAPSAAAGGARYGYGSPVHQALRELLPPEGDGVDTIEVTVYPLQQGPGSTAASGDITPSGTQTQAAAYRVRAGGVWSAPFVIPKDASVSHIIGSMMAAMQSVLEMPVSVVPAYSTPTSTAGSGNAGNGTLTALTAPGNPRPGAYKLSLLTAVPNGGVFRLSDPDGTVLSSSVTMTAGAGGATVINVAGLQFTLTDGTTDFASGDSFAINVVATKLNVVSRWKGDSANAIRLSIEGDSYGVAFAFTQPSGGAGNPSVAPALAQVGNVWETMIVNCLNESDTTALDAIQAFGESRWGALVHKPLVSFTGQTAAEVADAAAISGARPTDRVNAHISLPGSDHLPCAVAARGVARIAKTANNKPMRDYGSQRLTRLSPGPDSAEWDALKREAAVRLGSSTVETRNGVPTLCDVVTYYRPTGEQPPAFRYVCDIVKLQNLIFNLALYFESEDLDGAALVPSDQVTVTAEARKPKDLIAAANNILDSAGTQALISAPDVAKKKTTCTIDSQNPKRFNIGVRVQLSGNANVKDVGLNFGFYYGSAA